MKRFNKFDVIILLIFFLIALKIWSIPALSSPYLFGEGDSYWHYGQGDDIVEYDHVGSKLPYSYINKYFIHAPKLGPLGREYPPNNHINYANAILIGGHKFIPLGIFKAITSFLVFVGVYLLSRYLFSQIVAIIASFGVLFSNRSFSTFLFGQQPTTISFIFIPLILYLGYKILEKISKEEDFRNYALVLILSLISQFLFHIQGLVISIILLFSVFSLFFIKITLNKQTKKIKQLFSKRNIIFYLLSILLISITILPFFNIYFGRLSQETKSFEKDYSDLSGWGVNPEKVKGAYPSSFVSFKEEYSSLFFIFLFIGIVTIFIKHKNLNYLFLLGCLIGSYIIFHINFIISISINRIARMLIFEPYIFWIIIAIGASVTISLLTSSLKPHINKQKRTYIKYLLILVFLFLIYFTLGTPLKEKAESAYPEIIRVNSDELAAADWIKENLPLDSHIFLKNDHIQWRFYKYRFIRTIAHRPGYQSDNISKDISDWNEKYQDANDKYGTNLPLITNSYLLIDYSDYIKLANTDNQYKEMIEQFKGYENYYFKNISPIYNKKNIIIYNISGLEIE